MKLKIILTVCFIKVVCGQRRIMNGQDAVEGQFPYQALLLGDKDDCAGSIIHKRWILTAAHCVSSEVFTHISNLVVVVGTINPNTINSKKYEAEAFIEHENSIYTKYIVRDDIALIRLKSDMQFDKNVNLIKLPRDNSSTYEKSEAVISGFGLLRPKNTTKHFADTLQYITVQVEEQKQCKNSFGLIIRDSHLCTSTLDGQSTCKGDSGGPVVVDNTLVGIVSFGDGDCSISTPDVHTRVSYYLPWIKEKVKSYNDELP